MSLEKTLRRIVRMLDHLGIPYMVAGSIASSFHGVQRTTQDIDFVIDPNRDTLEEFIKMAGDEGFHVSQNDGMTAFKARSMFNVIDTCTAWKADLIIKKNRPYSLEEFGGRQCHNLFGFDVWICRPEDVILTKLEWSKRAGGSTLQNSDVQGMLEVRQKDLDWNYLKKWAETLGVEDTLEKLKTRLA